MADKQLKVALVGCGRIADAHADSIAALTSARLMAVCDVEPLMAEQLALRYGIERFYSDFDQMLHEVRPDIVHITTPPASHLQLAICAIEAGCHVLVEKPVALDFAQAKAMVASAVAAGRRLIPGYSYKFDPAAQKMRRLLSEGAIGEPVHIESFQGYNLAGPFGAAIMREPDHWVRKLPGQILQNNIDHLIYKIVEFITDEDPEIQVSGYFRPDGGFCDDLRVMIKGSTVSAYATFSSRIRPEAQYLRVCGTKNSMTVNYLDRTVVLDSSPPMPSMVGRLVPPFCQSWRYFKEGIRNTTYFIRSEFHFFDGMRSLMDLSYQSILRQTEPPISYPELLRTTRMMERIFAQLPANVCVH